MFFLGLGAGVVICVGVVPFVVKWWNTPSTAVEGGVYYSTQNAKLIWRDGPFSFPLWKGVNGSYFYVGYEWKICPCSDKTKAIEFLKRQLNSKNYETISRILKDEFGEDFVIINA